ncbi:hypothetical protein TcCL_ESM07509 [Trypanosoma cruzi]|nr:hypothetical protein TcCL_ESM07509 [Trypanosoma cruzi]
MLSVCNANSIEKDTEGDCPVHPPSAHNRFSPSSSSLRLGAAKRRQAKPRAWNSPMRRARLAATYAHSPTHILSHNFPTHKRAKTRRREARRTTHAEATPYTPHRKIGPCAPHTRQQREGQGAYKSMALSFTSHFPDKLELRPTAGRGEWRPTQN